MVEVQNVRKTVVFSYDKGLVKGKTISAQAAHPDAELVEKKNPKNTGFVSFSFGVKFHGPVAINVKGSTGGEDSGTPVVP